MGVLSEVLINKRSTDRAKEAKMIKKYQDELKALKILMSEAEKFAEKLPIFSETILNKKYTGNEEWISFGASYKGVNLTSWGINRGLYSSETARRITNYHKKSYTEFLFNIYINTYSLFGHHHKFGFEEVAKKVPVFFYDALNSTFYATDDQVTVLLDEILNWYVKAKKENEKFLAQKKIDDARKQLENAQKNLSKLEAK